VELLTQLHLGLGSFHRAHQAVTFQRLRGGGGPRGGEYAWSLASGDIRPGSAVVPALAAADGRYMLETISPAGEHRYERIESIRTVPYTEDLSGLIAIGARSTTPIISFTVTEAGYYLDPTDRLDVAQRDLAADLERTARGAAGTTIYGALVAILRARKAAGGGRVTLLCCDNLRHNGTRFRQALVQYCERAGDTALLHWIMAMTTCPNSMVDRITPRPTSSVRERVLAATGVDDPVAVVSESYHEWIIEDDFAAARPAWEEAGVQMVTAVAPYEEAKIRILNGSHSALAWAGTLAGHRYIHEDAQDARVRAIAHDYVTDDVIPALTARLAPYPIDLVAYRDTVLDRFANSGIADANQRVAMDGFAKFPGFIAPTLAERLAAGARIESSARVAAAFLKFLERWHRGTLPYRYEDQAMDTRVATSICTAADPLEAFCENEALFGSVRGHPDLVAAVRRAERSLEDWRIEARRIGEVIS
jgi:D-arabinitol 4-dehydrogenase